MARELTKAQVLNRATKMGFRGELKAYKDAQKSLGEKLNADIDWWYETGKKLVEQGLAPGGDVRAAADVYKAMMGKIAPELKETHRIDDTPVDDKPVTRAAIFVIGGNVKRGTVKAREAAQAIMEERRALERAEVEAATIDAEFTRDAD